MKHKSVAFPRGTYGPSGTQPGYAARCDTCGAVTFGGFRTKTEAKASTQEQYKETCEKAGRHSGCDRHLRITCNWVRVS